MGDVKIRYYVVRKFKDRHARGYWAPCMARPNKATGVAEPTLMAQLGFKHVDCGLDGPLAWSTAESWNRKWDEARQAHRAGIKPASIERIYPPDSLGEGFAKFRATAEYRNMKPRTKEGWMRGWKYIEPFFGDVNPRKVALEDIDLWYHGDPDDETIEGLLDRHGVGEAYIAVKYWRAIWAKLLTIKRADGERYCVDADPSLGIRRKTPKPRHAIWLEGEAVRLVKRAIRMGFHGLAAALATAWDTQFSPVDVRSVSLAKLFPDAQGPIFALDRAKTGRSALGTLSARTQRLLWAYVDSLPFTLHPETPLFHTRGSEPGPKGGRPQKPALYTKDTLSKDFRAVRAAEFPAEEKLPKEQRRKVMDFRRSGAVEATAGQVDPAALAGKMANSIDTNRVLQETYQPNHAAVVRLADKARLRGRSNLRGTAAAVKNENGT